MPNNNIYWEDTKWYGGCMEAAGGGRVMMGCITCVRPSTRQVASWWLMLTRTSTQQPTDQRHIIQCQASEGSYVSFISFTFHTVLSTVSTHSNNNILSFTIHRLMMWDLRSSAWQLTSIVVLSIHFQTYLNWWQLEGILKNTTTLKIVSGFT